MAFLRFSKYVLLLGLLAIGAQAQSVVRAGIQGPTWTALQTCANGIYVTASPDNAHVFRAVNSTSGTAGASQPTWNTSPGGITIDGTCKWLESGTSGLGGVSSSGTLPLSGTAANLPASPYPFEFYGVTDGSNSSDCISGGGSNANLCEWNGFAWNVVGVAGLPNPLTFGLGGTNTTNPCASATSNSVMAFTSGGFACVPYLIATGTGLQIGTIGTGITDFPCGVSSPGNPAAGYQRIWCNSSTNLFQCLTSAGANCLSNVTEASLATVVHQPCYASSTASPAIACADSRDVKIVPFCVSPGATATGIVSYGALPWTPTNRAGTNNIGCGLQAIPSTGATLQFLMELPKDWDTATQPYISVVYGSGGTPNSGTVVWTVSSACTKQDGSVTDDPTLNAESAFASQTMGAANRSWAQSGQFTLMTSGNNCIPGSPVLIKVALSGTGTSNINAYQAIVTIPTLPQAQAN